MSKYYMSYEEADKTIIGLTELLPFVKSFSITTVKKAEHYYQVEQMRKLLYKCADVHSIYDPEYQTNFNRYKKKVQSGNKKVELDAALHYCKESLYKDIVRHIVELRNLQNEILAG